MSKTHSSESKGIIMPVAVGVLAGSLTYFALFILLNLAHITLGSQVALQIDVVSFISVFVNIALAVYVLRTLQRRDEGDKVERDLLIEYFVKFESEFSQEVHQMTSSDGVEGTILAGMFKKYNMHLQELVDLTKSHFSGTLTKLNALKKSVSNVQELLMDTPKEGDIEDGVRLDGTRILYSPDYIGKITTNMGGFKKALFSVVVAINRS